MFSEEAVKKIAEAVELELASSKQYHNERFSSEYEAYAVSLEELEEVKEELEGITKALNVIWGGMRSKCPDDVRRGVIYFDADCKWFLQESVQLAAMARKFKELL